MEDKKLTPEEIHKLAISPLPIRIDIIPPQKTHASYGPYKEYDKPKES